MFTGKLFRYAQIIAVIFVIALIGGAVFYAYRSQFVVHNGQQVFIGLTGKRIPPVSGDDAVVFKRDVFRKFEARDYLDFSIRPAITFDETDVDSVGKIFEVSIDGQIAPVKYARNRALKRSMPYFQIPRRSREITIKISDFGKQHGVVLTRVDPMRINDGFIGIFALLITGGFAVIFLNPLIAVTTIINNAENNNAENNNAENDNAENDGARRRRFGIAFLAALILGVGVHGYFPSEYYDNYGWDYNPLTVEHAITFSERMRGTPNDGDMNINSHPGLPYYVASGVARELSIGGGGDTPVERAVYLFRNIAQFWRAQSLAAALIFAFGVGLLAFYSRNLPTLAVLAICCVPLLFINDNYIGILHLTNETFCLPFAAIFLLIARSLFAQIPASRKEKLWLIALGFVAGIIYTIKLPYIVFFVGGMLVVPTALAIRTKRISSLLNYAAVYFAGFALAGLVTIAAFGPRVVFSFLRYHFGVLTHSGFAGKGDNAITTTSDLISNLSFVVRVLFAQPPLLVAAFLLILVIFLIRRQFIFATFPRLAILALIATLYLLNVAAIWKHPYGYHYAFVQPVMLAFFIAELASMVFTRFANAITKKLLLSSAMLIFMLVSIIPPLRGFIHNLQNLPVLRENRDAALAQITALPLRENEGIYFQYGSHIMPFTATYLPLVWINIEYPTPSEFQKTVLAKLQYPTNYLCGITAASTKKNVRYLVVMSEIYLAEILENGNKEIRADDSPFERMYPEPADRILYLDPGLAVIEKAAPISPAELK